MEHIKITALQFAIQFHKGTVVTELEIIETAKKFEKYLKLEK